MLNKVDSVDKSKLDKTFCNALFWDSDSTTLVMYPDSFARTLCRLLKTKTRLTNSFGYVIHFRTYVPPVSSAM